MMLGLLPLIFLIGILSFSFGGGDYCYATSVNGTGLEETANKGFGGKAPFSNKTIPEIIGQVVGALLAFTGTIFLVLIIYAGFIWMIARGNQQEVTRAKDMMTQAIIGLIIILSAYGITKFIGEILFS